MTLSAALFYCLVQTLSRAGWLGAFVAAGTFAALTWTCRAQLGRALPSRAPSWLLVATGVCSAAILVSIALNYATLPEDGRNRHDAKSVVEVARTMLDVANPARAIGPERMSYWNAAVIVWRQGVWFGAGTGTYPLHKTPHVHPLQTNLRLFSAHNYYLQLLAELGVVGLSAFLWIVATLLWQIRDAWRHGDAARRFRLMAVTAGIVGFLTTLVTADALQIREVQYAFYSLAAMVVLEGREAQQGDC